MAAMTASVDGERAWQGLAEGVFLSPAAATPEATSVLDPAAVEIVAWLHRRLEDERRELLAARARRQAEIDAGALPGYGARAAEVAAGAWHVAEVPPDLRRRRVEITGPVSDPKMVLGMLGRNDDGHRADTAMLDFEDSMKPTWANVMAGVRNVREAVAGTLRHVKPAAGGQPGKIYALDPRDQAHLMVRVRGLHLAESNLRVDGAPVAGGLLDFVLTLFHTARALIERGRTPTYYVPKCEHYLEARWWNRLFALTQEALGLEPGTLRATFLIETLPAAFQMEEILYEIRDHAAGLNVGRWDKIFSDIKVLRRHPDRVMADRATIGLERPWMKNYALRLVDVCHRRGAYALGGMAAFTPGRTPETRRRQTAKVVADKELEAAMGHDGCWVSHPYFIGPALAAFERDHQLDVRPAVGERPDLLPEATPPRTLAGLRTNARVGIAYLEGWRRGVGCIAWDGLMEDLATLEISRAQTWQWLAHGVELDDGPPVTRELVERVFTEELERIGRELEAAGAGAAKERFAAAREEALQVFTEEELRPFLTGESELA